MPFKSKAQRAWMHANKPELAKEFEKKTPKGKKLPKYAPKDAGEDLDESFVMKIDKALGLFEEEAKDIDPQTTKGANRGPKKIPKGGLHKQYNSKSKAKQVEKEVLEAG